MNNSLLALITQEFRWLLFIRSYTRTLKQIHKFVQGVWFVFTLFNLQGTVVKATGFNLFILPHLISFVKNYFQVFPNFCGVIRCCSLPAFAEQLIYDITYSSSCQELFSCFLKFFVLSPLSRGQLAYITIP